jgi:hypothetical protein
MYVYILEYPTQVLHVSSVRMWLHLARQNLKLKWDFRECVLLLQQANWKQFEALQLKNEEDAVVAIMQVCSIEIKNEIQRVSSKLLQVAEVFDEEGKTSNLYEDDETK